MVGRLGWKKGSQVSKLGALLRVFLGMWGLEFLRTVLPLGLFLKPTDQWEKRMLVNSWEERRG